MFFLGWDLLLKRVTNKAATPLSVRLLPAKAPNAAPKITPRPAIAAAPNIPPAIAPIVGASMVARSAIPGSKRRSNPGIAAGDVAEEADEVVVVEETDEVARADAAEETFGTEEVDEAFATEEVDKAFGVKEVEAFGAKDFPMLFGGGL
jgi:hypothetical protein